MIQDLSGLTVQALAFRFVALLMIAAVQGGCMAAAAVALGDSGPRHDGRLSAWPTAHLDGIGGFCLVVFGLGWPRPLAVEAGALRPGRAAILAVILAGVLGLLLLASGLRALLPPALETLPHTAALTTAAFLRVASDLALWMALFALVPVPPLAAGMLWAAWGLAPRGGLRWALVALLVLAVASGWARRLLAPAHDLLVPLLPGG